MHEHTAMKIFMCTLIANNDKVSMHSFNIVWSLPFFQLFFPLSVISISVIYALFPCISSLFPSFCQCKPVNNEMKVVNATTNSQSQFDSSKMTTLQTQFTYQQLHGNSNSTHLWQNIQ